jgi:hypothetical protein
MRHWPACNFPLVLLTMYALRQAVVEPEMYSGEDVKPRNTEDTALTLSPTRNNSKSV